MTEIEDYYKPRIEELEKALEKLRQKIISINLVVKENLELLEENLCFSLDNNLYIPVKKELEGRGVQYSLGMRKEDFKVCISEEIKKLKERILK